MSTREQDDHRLPLPEGYDETRTMVLSASQFKTFDLCKRKWWFLKCMKLPDKKSTSHVFGKALHAALERWLLADDRGIDPQTGKPVDIYPKGWSEGLTPREADLLQKLVAEGISSGLIVRHPGREIERGFMRLFAETGGGSKDTPDGWSIFLTGFIDLMVQDLGLIQDHKSTKSMRYALSKNKLSKDVQMTLYAAELLHLRPELQEVDVQHNVFVKDMDKPRIRFPATKATLPRAEIESTWSRYQGTALEMLALKHRWTDINQHALLPDPPKPAKSCNSYGGCPFQLICGGRETPQEYAKRMEDQVTNIFEEQLAAAKGSAVAVAPGATSLNGPVPPPSNPQPQNVPLWWAPPGT